MKQVGDFSNPPALYSVHRNNFLPPWLWPFPGETEQDVSQSAQRQEPDHGSARSSRGPQPAQHGQRAGYGGQTGGEHHWSGQ